MRPLTFVSLAESETSLAGCSYSFSLDFNATPTTHELMTSKTKSASSSPMLIKLVIDSSLLHDCF